MARNENKTQTESGSERGKWKWQENSNHKLGIYLRSVNDYHLKCARLPPKNQLLEKAQPTKQPSGWCSKDTAAEGVKGPKATYVFYA
ncbi:uncharacterized protein LOC122614502 [Drosophila teissieri]|uniref:uncharacterized protein LOC122614502 n=1 Tax=Drosophila teissieri TaxID=7243 RepID=UPI001CBA5534|nr:uncharacterized protein LOC122614502 [Drosophila teissieri]